MVHTFDCSLELTEELFKNINVWIPYPRNVDLFGLEFCLCIGNFIIFSWDSNMQLILRYKCEKMRGSKNKFGGKREENMLAS